MDIFDQQIQTVSQVTRQIKNVLETGFQSLSIEGEISNYKQQSSGHIYLTLKDEAAQLSAVIWRSSVIGLTVQPENGMKVVAEGRLSVYEPHGKYQLVISKLKPVGIGDLQLAFEALKKKLYMEGLFNEIHKKNLPEYPQTIGIVTSPTGAAVQDLISVISRRNPLVTIYLLPVKVQGEGSANEIASAIHYFNHEHPVDVLIVGRGGGSLEDLWAFNEEVVARAIFESDIPVISAVGHEVDYTISDFVADFRAATPSMAGEIAVKDKREIVDQVLGIREWLISESGQLVYQKRQMVAAILKSRAFNRPIEMVNEQRQKQDFLMSNLQKSMTSILKYYKEKMLNNQQYLEAYNPENVLKRGYTLVLQNGQIIPNIQKLDRSQKLDVRFHDGVIKTTPDT